MIEEQIQKLIDAINANTEAVKHLTKQQLDFTPSETKPVYTNTVTQPIKLVEADKPAPVVEKPAPVVEKPVTKVVTPAPKVFPDLPSLEMLTELALKTLSLGPEAAKRIKTLNESHGIERITKCPPDKINAVYASLKQLRQELGGVE